VSIGSLYGGVIVDSDNLKADEDGKVSETKDATLFWIIFILVILMITLILIIFLRRRKLVQSD
jgi:hypothetical protein